MRFLLTLCLLVLGLWAFDINPLSSHATAYLAVCDQEPANNTCSGNLNASNRIVFLVSQSQQLVLKNIAGKTPDNIGICEVKDRKNWECRQPSPQDYRIVIEHKMVDGLYLPARLNQGEKETNAIMGLEKNTVPVRRHEWYGLTLRKVITNLPQIIENLKENFPKYKKQVMDALTGAG